MSSRLLVLAAVILAFGALGAMALLAAGNGREWGEFGFEEFLEVKAVLGHNAA
jgi:hypothetical protein